MSETSCEVPAESVGSPDAVLDSLEAMQPESRGQREGSRCGAVYPGHAETGRGNIYSEAAPDLEPQMPRRRAGTVVSSSMAAN